LPLVLAHSEIIKPGASIMSLIGGGYVRSLFGCFRASCIFDNQTLTQHPRAVSYMRPSWLTPQRSGKTILNTSNLRVPSVLAYRGPVVPNSYRT
jgi:hypothetical protein